MPPLSLLIKPASSLCNRNCDYCFYRDEAASRKVASYGLMTEDTARAVIRAALDFADKSCTFAFQGGEPTLAGLPFFERFVTLCQEENYKNLPIRYALQTNAQALGDGWARFFKEHAFLVGVSLDGGEVLHDLHRGEGTYAAVLRTLDAFDRAGVAYNFLSVVTAETRPGTWYAAMKRTNCAYWQPIAVLGPLDGAKRPYLLTADAYGRFLCRVFDLWYADFRAGNRISLRSFEGYLRILAGMPPETCSMNGRCSMQTVVEADGSVYPCDFYATDAYRLGNLTRDSMETILGSPALARFVQRSLKVPELCRTCRYYPLCRNGCVRERDAETGINRFCAGYRRFFEYALPRMREILKTLCLPS